MIWLRFASLDLAGSAAEGVTLHEAVRGLGHVIDLACGGRAACASCCVLVSEGEERIDAPRAAELAQLRQSGLGLPWRLSCQARLRAGDGEVTLVAC